MFLDAERTIVVFVLAHNWIFKNQETNGAVKSLTDNNLEAILFIAKIVFVFTARHYSSFCSPKVQLKISKVKSNITIQ